MKEKENIQDDIFKELEQQKEEYEAARPDINKWVQENIIENKNITTIFDPRCQGKDSEGKNIKEDNLLFCIQFLSIPEMENYHYQKSKLFPCEAINGSICAKCEKGISKTLYFNSEIKVLEDPRPPYFKQTNIKHSLDWHCPKSFMRDILTHIQNNLSGKQGFTDIELLENLLNYKIEFLYHSSKRSHYKYELSKIITPRKQTKTPRNAQNRRIFTK